MFEEDNQLLALEMWMATNGPFTTMGLETNDLVEEELLSPPDGETDALFESVHELVAAFKMLVDNEMLSVYMLDDEQWIDIPSRAREAEAAHRPAPPRIKPIRPMAAASQTEPAPAPSAPTPAQAMPAPTPQPAYPNYDQDMTVPKIGGLAVLGFFAWMAFDTWKKIQD